MSEGYPILGNLHLYLFGLGPGHIVSQDIIRDPDMEIMQWAKVGRSKWWKLMEIEFPTYVSTMRCISVAFFFHTKKTSPTCSIRIRPATARATNSHPQSWPNASVVLPFLPVDGQPDIPRGSHPDWLRRTDASYEGTSWKPTEPGGAFDVWWVPPPSH